MPRKSTPPNSHGKDLERAVKGIEEVIYRNQPELRGRKVDLDGNWRFKHVGAGHEIDLLVTVDAGTASEERHVYECKNRNEPTDKDTIIVLIYKLNALGAKSGMLISRNFTSGAEAIAASDPRIKLVHFTDEFTTVLDEVQWTAISIDSSMAPTTVTFKEAWAGAMHLRPSLPAVMRGSQTTFGEVVNSMADRKFEEILRMDDMRLPEGLHSMVTSCREVFGPMEFLLGGCDVMFLQIELPFLLSVRVARLHAKFNVEGRGASYRLDWDPDPFEGHTHSLEIITKPVPLPGRT